jgi:DME family drug/metabolite transporter
VVRPGLAEGRARSLAGFALGVLPNFGDDFVTISGGQATIGRRCVLAAAVLWSLSGVVTKGLDLDPGSIAFYRSLFAGLSLLAIVRPSKWVFRPVMLPLCLTFGAMIGLYIAAIKATTAANAIFLQCSSTFWVVPLGLIFLRERPDRRSLIGIALATAGLVAIVGFGHHGGPAETRGIALGLGSGVGFAVVMIGMRGLRDLDPLWLSAVNNLGGAIALGAWIVATGGTIAVPTFNQGLVLAAFGVIQMAIPYALFARGLRDVSAAEAGLIGLLEPVLNPIWVVIFHGEIPHRLTIIGGAFLLLGVAARYVPSFGRSAKRPEPAESV